MLSIGQRFASLRANFNRPVPKILLIFWAIVCTYDTVVSQFLPSDFGQRLPKTWEILVSMSSLFPLFSLSEWLVILLVLLLGITLEYAFRRDSRNVGGDTLIATAVVGVDASEWTNDKSYFVWAAACLWVNMKPAKHIDSMHPAYPSLQKIESAIDSGQIKSLDGSSSMTAMVSREELVKLALMHGDKPKFLFGYTKTQT